jgi:hypothetical protein
MRSSPFFKKFFRISDYQIRGIHPNLSSPERYSLLATEKKGECRQGMEER